MRLTILIALIGLLPGIQLAADENSPAVAGPQATAVTRQLDARANSLDTLKEIEKKQMLLKGIFIKMLSRSQSENVLDVEAMKETFTKLQSEYQQGVAVEAALSPLIQQANHQIPQQLRTWETAILKMNDPLLKRKSEAELAHARTIWLRLEESMKKASVTAADTLKRLKKTLDYFESKKNDKFLTVFRKEILSIHTVVIDLLKTLSHSLEENQDFQATFSNQPLSSPS